jgi:hypothetical protein
MKNIFKKEQIYPIKKGVDYTILNIRPFDLVLFNGGDTVSSFIERLSVRAQGKDANLFSHVGMIITKDILPDEVNMEYNKLYIFESTASGSLGGKVYNIDGKTFIGCQIRDFDEVMKSYDSNPKSSIAIRHLKNNPLDVSNINTIQRKMAYLYGKYNYTPYEINIMNLFEAMFPKLRKLRIKRNENKFIFCSELVATIYKNMGILPSTCNPADVVPSDFVTRDLDKQVDLNIFDKIQYIFYNYL